MQRNLSAIWADKVSLILSKEEPLLDLILEYLIHFHLPRVLFPYW